MTQETQDLQAKIDAKRAGGNRAVTRESGGFGFAMAMMMDLVCCLLVGVAVGMVIQKYFRTTPLVVVAFALLGGVAGLVSVVRTGMNRSKT